MLLGSTLPVTWAQDDFVPNYDEEKVPVYSLPDPLIMADGSAVQSPFDWTQNRRPELLRLFEEEMYGRMPGADVSRISFEILAEKNDALNGKATRREVRLFFNAPNPQPKIDLLIYIPNQREGAVPAFVGLNFQGNVTTSDEPDILVTEVPDRMRNPGIDLGTMRGAVKNRWAYEKIVDRGYAVITGYYEEIDPDYNDGYRNGVHPLFAGEFPDTESGDYPSSITAWAWGLSRILDILESFPEIDNKRVIVMGHSRLGKTALWAGACDERFAAAVSNDSGCGGAALSRREFGETTTWISGAMPHWFCRNFQKYRDNVKAMPFDQHELIALMAPRPVYIASAAEDLWADPRGEFLAALNADPVYRLLGTGGIGDVKSMPEVNWPVGDVIRYHVRSGDHDVTDYDWEQYLDFADACVR
ncbi:MAG: acetylxylan esterase [Thermoguttaceae bacterium]|nr:acetylxylan esterase [Thermoguttaceae bacterium]